MNVDQQITGLMAPTLSTTWILDSILVKTTAVLRVAMPTILLQNQSTGAARGTTLIFAWTPNLVSAHAAKLSHHTFLALEPVPLVLHKYLYQLQGYFQGAASSRQTPRLERHESEPMPYFTCAYEDIEFRPPGPLTPRPPQSREEEAEKPLQFEGGRWLSNRDTQYERQQQYHKQQGHAQRM